MNPHVGQTYLEDKMKVKEQITTKTISYKSRSMFTDRLVLEL